MKLSKQKLKQIIKEELEAAMDEGYRPFSGKPAPDLPFLKTNPEPMTDEEADAKHASSMAAIVAALKAEYGDRVKTVKIGGEKAEDLVQAIKEIDPTADVEISDK